MSIEIRQEEHGEVRLLVLSGRLDTETSADLELALQDLQAAGAAHFVIDLADIGYVSSAGLRVLLALAKQLDGGRGSLKLCALNPAVKQVFDVAGFSNLFAIFPHRDAALGVALPAAAVVPRAPESGLAKRAATLLGAGDAGGAADPSSAALADSAARLLGAGKTAPDSQPAKPNASAKAKPRQNVPATPATTANADPAAQPSGVLGKFRNLFGSRK